MRGEAWRKERMGWRTLDHGMNDWMSEWRALLTLLTGWEGRTLPIRREITKTTRTHAGKCNFPWWLSNTSMPAYVVNLKFYIDRNSVDDIEIVIIFKCTQLPPTDTLITLAPYKPINHHGKKDLKRGRVRMWGCACVKGHTPNYNTRWRIFWVTWREINCAINSNV